MISSDDLRFSRWSDWWDEVGVTALDLSLIDSSRNQIVRTIPVDPSLKTWLFSDLSLEIGTKYYATVSATNKGGLASLPERSSGITITGAGASTDAKITVHNGVSLGVNGTLFKASVFFLYTPLCFTILLTAGWLCRFVVESESSIHIFWKLRSDSAARPQYFVTLRSSSGVTTLANPSHTTGQSDLVIPFPSRLYTYNLSVSAISTDGYSQTAYYPELIWIAEDYWSKFPKEMYRCQVDFTHRDPVERTAFLTASWSSPSNPMGIDINQTISFRRIGDEYGLSDRVNLGSSALNTTVNQAVHHLYGHPSAVDPFPVECVYEAVGDTGRSYTATFNGTTIWDHSQLWNASVMALSTWTLFSSPSSSQDFVYFTDLALTPNNSFVVGLRAFPPIMINGEQVADVTYSIGTWSRVTLTIAPTLSTNSSNQTVQLNATVPTSNTSNQTVQLNATELTSDFSNQTVQLNTTELTSDSFNQTIPLSTVSSNETAELNTTEPTSDHFNQTIQLNRRRILQI